MQLLVLANEDVGRQIYFLRRYESNEIDYLREAILPTDICFDIGANTGFFSLLMGTAAREGAVYAFEPIPLAYHLLAASVILNDLPIRTFQLAVSDRDGKAEFSQSEDSAYSSLVAVGRSPEVQKIPVETVTISEFVRREVIPRIDVLKIDVEGAEELVLRGGATVITNPRIRPKLVMVELYDVNLEVFGSSIERVVTLMREYGYEPFVSMGRRQLRSFEPCDRNRFYNIFFVPGP